jgi:hypothetical protein
MKRFTIRLISPSDKQIHALEVISKGRKSAIKEAIIQVNKLNIPYSHDYKWEAEEIMNYNQKAGI